MAESLRQVLCFQVGHDRRDSSFDSGILQLLVYSIFIN